MRWREDSVLDLEEKNQHLQSTVQVNIKLLITSFLTNLFQCQLIQVGAPGRHGAPVTSHVVLVKGPGTGIAWEEAAYQEVTLRKHRRCFVILIDVKGDK